MSTSGKWIVALIIILTSLVQAFIWYVSFINAGNGSALNFVSFAGTLISIILAVLAIGYTYGESINQKGKSDSLSVQISALTEVTSNIKTQADAISEVSNIKTELESVAQRIESGFLETKKNVSDVSTAIDTVNRRFDEINLTRRAPFTASGLDKAEVSSSLLAARTPIMEISILIIAYFADVKKIQMNSEQCNRELKKIFEKLIHDGHEVFETEVTTLKLFTGSVVSCISVLEGFGLLFRSHGNDMTHIVYDEEDEDEEAAEESKAVSINPALRRELIRTVVKNPMKSGPFYAAIREFVVSQLSEHPLWDI